MRENFYLFQNTLIKMTADDEIIIDETAVDNFQKTEEDCAVYALYECYVDGIVENEILTAAKNSLKYLYDEFRVPSPLFEVCFSLDIENRTSIFHPDLAVDATEGFVSFVASLMVDIIGMGGLIKRIKRNFELNEPSSFINMLKNDDTIENYRLDILVKSKVVSKHTIANFEQYQNYSSLWKINRTSYLNAFLKYGRELSEDDMIKINEGTFDIEPMKPTLEDIEHEIKRHRDLIPAIEAIPEFIDTEPWFRIKMHLFKTKLVNETIEWVNLFMNYLNEHVTNRLNQLEVFILNANIVLSVKCDKGELQKFRQIYDLTNEIDRQAEEVDYMFPPLKAEMMLLRKYDQEMDDKVRKQFVELPLWWEKLKKLSKHVSKDVEPVREHQMGLTLKRLKLFTLRINDFQQRFRNQAIFESNCKNAYEIIDKMLDHIIKYERQAEMLDIYAALFNINVGPNHDLMMECRKETKVLKQVWDYWYSMQYRIYLWENTLWSKIDVESVESECKRIAKEVRALDSCCKQWEPYVVLDDELLNLMTSLRVLTSIQNPSIKERHIDELRNIVGFYFEINEQTTFNDLVMLKLHLHEDQVKELVDKAVKELQIEKALHEIVKVWTDIGFEYEEAGNKILLKMSDDFMELLEDHLTQLQSMMDSKFVGYFHDTVSEWLKKVFTIQQVVELWMEAQRKWVYLEVIFTGIQYIK